MGSVNGKDTICSTTSTTLIQEEYPNTTISELDVNLLKNDWALVKSDVERVGVITFLRLFETHPECQDTFLEFKSLSTGELEYNRILRAHALRVMTIVDKCITRLDDAKQFHELMTKLGMRHGTYNKVKTELIDLIGPQFVVAIKSKLTDVWDNYHEETWLNLFKILSLLMKEGMMTSSG